MLGYHTPHPYHPFSAGHLPAAYSRYHRFVHDDKEYYHYLDDYPGNRPGYFNMERS